MNPSANPGAAAIQGFGAAGVNNLTPPTPVIHLRLAFVDPEGIVRNFPAGVPVTVLYGMELSPPGAGQANYTTTANGLLEFPAWLATPCRSCTLRFRWVNQIPYLLYEPNTSPPAAATSRYVTVATGAADPPFLSVPAASPPPSPPGSERGFSLPPSWDMIEADWYDRGGGARPFALKGAFAGNGNYTPATGRISQTATPAADIGTTAAPIDFVLDPHWLQFRFEFFDRYYGNGALNSPPTAGHGRRISTPAVWLEGFRNNAAATPADADTVSNWTIGADPLDALQCLPFILSKNNAGAALPAPNGARLGLRFRTHQTRRTFVYSQSNTVRELQHLDNSPPGNPVPGPNRLRYYDLPRLWKSKNYYTRNVPASPPADGKYFQVLSSAEILAAEFKVINTAAARPLHFSLDDIVLTDATLTQLPLAALPAAPAIGERVTIFHHKFGNRPYQATGNVAGAWANLSNEGVHKPGNAVDAAGYPYSDISMPVRYYITDYPNWTRLVLAQGNAWDTFEDRTPDVVANAVVGARAAVRWVDATTAPNGVAPVGSGAGTGSLSPRPGPTQRPYFAIQPYHEQRFIITYGGFNPQAVPVYHNEWNAAWPSTAMGIGRYDSILLRCADYEGADEVATVVRYLRLTLDFVNPSNDNSSPSIAQPNPLGGAPAPAPPVTQMVWAQSLIDNSLARWNGHDAHNDARIWASPRPASPPAAAPPFKAQVVTIFHYLPIAWSHSNIRCAHWNCTSFMGASNGDGQIRSNATIHDAGGGNDIWGRPRVNRGLAAAHEFGHGLSLPDEYDNNRGHSLFAAALNVLGSPYNLENRGMMFFNWYVRARHLWVAAEWLRRLNGLTAVNFMLSHNDTAAPGAARETNYFLPHYPAANPTRNFVSWPVSFNLGWRTGPDTTFFDSVLYILGDDKYSSTILPSRAPTGMRIDGLLVVQLRLRFDFTGIAAAPAATRDAIYTAVTAAIEPNLNFARFAQFSPSNVSPPAGPSFNNCLLHFRACFNTIGLTVPVGGPNPNSPAANDAGAPHHFRVVLQLAPAAPPLAAPAQVSFANNAPPTAKVLTINLPNGYLGVGYANFAADNAAIANLVWQHACTCLGLSSANAPAVGSFQTPASFVNIVRTVMDAGTPNPNIS